RTERRNVTNGSCGRGLERGLLASPVLPTGPALHEVGVLTAAARFLHQKRSRPPPGLPPRPAFHQIEAQTPAARFPQKKRRQHGKGLGLSSQFVCEPGSL